MHQKTIPDPENSSFDEDAAMEAAQERSNVPQLRDTLNREHDEVLKGRPRDIAFEKWGADLELDIMLDLEKEKIS